MFFSGASTLTNPFSIDTSSNNQAIFFASTIDGGQDLTLTAGTENITLSGDLGSTTRLGSITIVSVEDFTAGDITAAALTQTAGSGTTAISGTIDTDAISGISLTGTQFDLTGDFQTSNTGPFSLVHSDAVTIDVSPSSIDGNFTEGGGRRDRFSRWGPLLLRETSLLQDLLA